MTYPEGVQVATLTFSNAGTFTGQEATRTTMEIVSTASVVWSATGEPIDNFAETIDPGEGMPGSLTAPFVNQPGFTDQLGNDFTMWAYKLTRDSRTRAGSKRVIKVWQPILGQTTVDFDNLPGGNVGLPVSTPIPPVTSVAGETGAVQVEALADALAPFLPDGVTPETVEANLPERLGEAALTATIVDNAATGRRSSDAITSWWCNPRAHYDDMRKRVYFSGVARSGLQHVGYFDLREKTAKTFPIFDGDPDDHNTPAMLIEDDRPPIVLAPQHGQEAKVYYRKGTAPHALDTLGDLRSIPFTGSTSYASILRQPGTDNIAVMTRDEGNAAGWTVSRSADYGETWGAPFRLFGSGYVAFRQVGNTVHGIAAGHPITSYGGGSYFRIDLTTGDIFNAHEPASVKGNLWTTTAVISTSSLTSTHTTGAGITPYDTSRTLDVGPSGSLAAMLFTRSAPELGGQYTVLRHKAGGSWTKEPLTMSGAPLGYNESSYVGGMAFGATDNEIYLCRENAGTWTLERWATTAAGQPWIKAETVETRTDGGKLGRPIMPRKGESAGHIIYGDYHRYMPDNYYDYMADQMVL